MIVLAYEAAAEAYRQEIEWSSFNLSEDISP